MKKGYINISTLDPTSSKQSINFSKTITTIITEGGVDAEIDAWSEYEQVYTFGQSIPNRWVAVGEIPVPNSLPFVDAMAYSSDGMNWTGLGTSVFGNPATPLSIFPTGGYGVAWNGSMWVAVGSGGGLASPYNETIAYSKDGIKWAYATPSAFYTVAGGGQGNGVAWNGSMWVAVGGGGTTIAYSSGGINWTSVTSPSAVFGSSGNSVAWNGSIWVAVGEGFGGPGEILHSTDGITWISAASIGAILTTNVNDVAWNGSMWIAVGYGASTSDTMAYSYDGDTWVVVTLSLFSQGHGIAWNGSMWVAVGYGTGLTPLANTIAYSYDGFNWVGIAGGLGFVTNGNKVAWNGSMWLASGFDSGAFLGQTAYSTNGINWTVVNSTIIYEYYGVAYNSLRPNTITFPTNRIVAVGDVSGGGTNTIAYSSDGITWTGLGNSIFQSIGVGVAWNGLKWVAVGEGINTIAYSSDGITWTGIGSLIFTTRGIGVAWNDSMWVAVGNGADSIAHSPDGMAWTGITGTSIFTTGQGVAWNGSMWVAVGQGAYSFAYSSDGVAWTGVTNSIFNNTIGGLHVAWNGLLWVAVGDGSGVGNHSIATWNGTGSWIGVTGTSIFTTGRGVAWNGSMWVAVGAGTNSIAYSFNGTNWIGVTGITIFGSSGIGVAWTGSMWVAVGYGAGTNSIATSPDGITWTGVTSSTIFNINYGGYGVAWNSGKGSVKIKDISGTLSLNAYGPGLSNKLDVVSSQYYNTGFNNFSVRFK
jgi:hypothetical protein